MGLMRTVRAAGSGDELDAQSARLLKTDDFTGAFPLLFPLCTYEKVSGTLQVIEYVCIASESKFFTISALQHHEA